MDQSPTIEPIFSSKLFRELQLTSSYYGNEKFYEFLKDIHKDLKITEELPKKTNSLIFLLLQNIEEAILIEKLKQARKRSTISVEVFQNITTIICNYYGIDEKSIFVDTRYDKQKKKAITLIVIYLLRTKHLLLEDIAYFLLRTRQAINQTYVSYFNSLDSKNPEENQIIEDYKKIKELLNS